MITKQHSTIFRPARALVATGLAALFAVSLAAGQPVSAQSAGPALILEDSVILQETAQVYVGQPLEMFLGDDGSLFVVDGFSNSVVRFDEQGRLLVTYGKYGGGPGEFEYIMGGGFAHRVMGVLDGRPPRQQMEFFDLESGRHLGKVETSDVVTTLVPSQRALWVGGINTEKWTALASRPWRNLPGGRSWSSSQGSKVNLDRGTVPQPYTKSDMLMWMGGTVRIHADDADLLVGFGTSPFLLRVDPAGVLLDTIPLLAAKRRGVPSDDEMLEVTEKRRTGEMSYAEIFRAWSFLANLSRSGGYAFTIHQDSELHGQQVSGRLYASSLKEDGTEQCADTPIPTSDVSRPIAAFQGSSLYVLDQRIHDDDSGADRLRTVVRRFTVDPADCTGQVSMGRVSVAGRP